MFVAKLPTFEKQCGTPPGNMPHAANWKRFFCLFVFNYRLTIDFSLASVNFTKLNAHCLNF